MLSYAFRLSRAEASKYNRLLCVSPGLQTVQTRLVDFVIAPWGPRTKLIKFLGLGSKIPFHVSLVRNPEIIAFEAAAVSVFWKRSRCGQPACSMQCRVQKRMEV